MATSCQPLSGSPILVATFWQPHPGDHILAAMSWQLLLGDHILAATSWRPLPSDHIQAAPSWRLLPGGSFLAALSRILSIYLSNISWRDLKRWAAPFFSKNSLIISKKALWVLIIASLVFKSLLISSHLLFTHSPVDPDEQMLTKHCITA